MSCYGLLNDEPASVGGDKLHFSRYLNAIERRVLQCEDASPFVVGIYGSWGSGKTSLMGMIRDQLKEEPEKWEIVEFSPWMYRNEKSLLLPLLATIAKNRKVFEKLVKGIVESGPGLIKALASVTPVAKAGLPLITFLDDINKKREKARDFAQKVSDAVNEVTGKNKRMVFFIDDLDRCHDHNQIIGLLEQIKLFLHLERCLFFIGADKEQIIKAIERQFPGEGRNYLDKFIQLPIELSPHHSQHLMDLLGVNVNDDQYHYLTLVAEVLANNPRKLKKLWNQAVVGLEILHEENGRVNHCHEEPSIELMLKWLLLSECENLRSNPYLYLKFENKDEIRLDDLYREFALKNSDGSWRSDLHQRLALFICRDLKRHRFKTKETLSLYARTSGEDLIHSRMMIESDLLNGKTEFKEWQFTDADLSYGMFTGAQFANCQFINSRLRHADLKNAAFRGCDLFNACFDEADIDGANFINCRNVDRLNTNPDKYEEIANRIIDNRDKTQICEGTEQLYKMYRTILELHREANTLTPEIETRLKDRGKQVRAEILGSEEKK